jgi:hypothetical protein
MFITRPGDPLEAVLDVKAERPVDLRISVERPGGGSTLLHGGSGPPGGEFTGVVIPPTHSGSTGMVIRDRDADFSGVVVRPWDGDSHGKVVPVGDYGGFGMVIRPRDTEPVRVVIPPLLDGDRLRIDLGVMGEDEDDLLDVNVAFMQGGFLVQGSEHTLRERLNADGRFVLDYHQVGGGMVKMHAGAESVAPHVDNVVPLSPPPSPAPSFPNVVSTSPTAEPEAAPGYDGTATVEVGGSETVESAPPGDAGPGHSDHGGPGGEPPQAGGPVVVERRINVWMKEREDDKRQPLVTGERYTLCVNVGLPVAASLAEGPEAIIAEDDIPPAGLATEWVIQSSTAELQALGDDVQVTHREADGISSWTAQYRLLVPRGADSETVRVACIPHAVEDARLQVLVYAIHPQRAGRAELYRQLDVALSVVAPAVLSAVEKTGASEEAVRMGHEVIHAPARQMNLRTTHEWTTPRDMLSIKVLGPVSALANGDVGNRDINNQITLWNAPPSEVVGLITNLRRALERFRGTHERYLDAIDLADLDRRLGKMEAGADFFGVGEPPSDASLAAWDAVSRSAELYELAFEGRRLYNKVFGAGSKLREWIELMQQHDRLDINLQADAGAAFVPHVPWGLMYGLELPVQGEPVEPIGFLGLRLRLGYSAHLVDAPSKALGRPDSVQRAFLLYWGDQPTDPTAIEARWQRDRWAARPNHAVVPSDADGGRPKQRLVALLRDPIRLLYLYCQCKAEQGNDPELRFAHNTQADNVVRRMDLGLTPLAEQPLVFANACTTSAADPFMSNELEAGFFDRGARAYLGTESKVPITLASRFAAVFFHYFDRRASDQPMAAGEAVYQARQFLWRHYRNLGGLFYTYVNQYELYMADDPEVDDLRS